MSGALVLARGVRVRLGGVPVLHEVDLDVRAGSWLVVVGPNGAGKSTLLKVLAGLTRAAGSVTVDGEQVAAMRPRQRARLLSYAPQSPVLPDTVVRDYVMLGRTPHRPLLAAPRAADIEVVAQAMSRLDLQGLASRRLATLSGGEVQRAVLARALAQRPQLLLLDEPTSALDLGHAQQVLELIDRLRLEEGMTVISTLHDLGLAGQYGGALVLLDGGRVVAAGEPRQVLTAEALLRHYGARAEVVAGPDGVRVHPVRPR